MSTRITMSWCWAASVIVGLGCTPATHPTLELTLSPRTSVNGTPIRVRAVGTTAAGKIGSGSVQIKSVAGSLITPVEAQFDDYGVATTNLVCDPLTEPACREAVKVSATWSSDGEVVTAEVTLNASGPGSVAAGGGSGGEMIPDAGAPEDPSRNCTRNHDGGSVIYDIVTVKGKLGSQGDVNYTVWGSSVGRRSNFGFFRMTYGITGPRQPWMSHTVFSAWDATVDKDVAKVGTNAGSPDDAQDGGPTFVDFQVQKTSGPSIVCPMGAGLGTFTIDDLQDGGFSFAFVRAAIHGTYSFDCPDAGISVSGCFRYRPD